MPIPNYACTSLCTTETSIYPLQRLTEIFCDYKRVITCDGHQNEPLVLHFGAIVHLLK